MRRYHHVREEIIDERSEPAPVKIVVKEPREPPQRRLVTAIPAPERSFPWWILLLFALLVVALVSYQPSPRFEVLAEGIVLQERTEETVFADLKHTCRYLKERDIRPLAIYVDLKQVTAIVSVLNLSHKRRLHYLVKHPIIIDCRGEQGMYGRAGDCGLSTARP